MKAQSHNRTTSATLTLQISRKILLSILLITGLQFHASGQPNPMQLANAELRSLFSNVSNPNTQVKFFYDMAAHFTDSVFFHHFVTDTSNASNWYGLYEEMYYMAYDTTLFATATDVYDAVAPKMQSDTIPIGIIDWDFNLLKPDALTTGNYFIFDTVNTLLYNINGNPNPFTIQTTFAGAALRESYPFTNPVFMVNPQWIFKDSYKDYKKSVELKIDFGDGTGWHVFADNIVGHYQATYASSGVKAIQYGIFINGTLKRYAISAFKITGSNPAILPAFTFGTGGINASFFEPDAGCNLNTEKKYVIYLEGFDALNHRHASQIYEEMILNPQLSQLKNFGYTFVVVDWKNGNAALEHNAMDVINLIEYLKCSTPPATDYPPQPFVIIGESMGGLIARYALCYMESPQYNPSCGKGINHNTRLLITIDSPHQGANIPIGLQYMYRYGVVGMLKAVGFNAFAIGAFKDYLLVLDGAATEMLKYHVSTDPFIAVPVSLSPITEHPAKTVFDAQLLALGNYPRNCKLVALSNGSWVGAHQPRAWDGAERQPNDKIIDMTTETYIKVLGIKILGTVLGLKVRTNPDNNGQVLFAGIGVSHWKIKLKWFGVKLVWWTDYTLQVDKKVTHVKPYCVMPGSTLGYDGIGIGLNDAFSSFNLLDFFGFQYSAGNGSLHLQANCGWPLLGNANINFNAYSDGGGFGFIHPASSTDYNTPSGQALDYSLLADPIVTTLSRTPFDVVRTNPETDNWHHLMVYNPALSVCQTCTTFPDQITSRLLNREIGDDSLWLENTNAKYNVPIEAERDVLINHRNLYYNYSSQFGIPNFSLDNFPANYTYLDGAIVLSKENSVIFSIPGEFKSNDALTVNPNQPPVGSYSWQQGGMTICCINYNYRLSGQSNETSKKNEGSMVIFPNPVTNRMTIKYQMTNPDKVQINLYDVTGRKIANWQPAFKDNSQVCYYAAPIDELNLLSGIYLIELSNGKETYRSKLVINK